MERSIFAAAVGLVVALFVSSAAYAAYEVPLRGMFYSQAAEGSVTVESSDIRPNQDDITVEVSGLKPGSVYTVWLAQSDPSMIQGLGVEDYSFTTDQAGYGRFNASVNEGELYRWDTLEVAHHPNGDPTDLDNAQIALRGDLGR